ncbi:chemotaxis protein CheW [Duganella sp. FT50W]|uniref:Chemotaxis protein CheW n=1 Tax=Duganella lactea TaxID=2692173 RepID=A0A6L8MF30_9BURK|nr:chemotaxis protein CheW [Duganella lactea]MYM36343.1 chemotaxis protein CheW [Duganella lactea]MYM81510.1 chemotaxis protein CheW [Duganella lactea]
MASPNMPAAEARQYLVFRLGGLDYALDFTKVQELRPLQALERFSSAGEIISGVVVSRGVIMPIVDMRVAFGPRPPQHDPLTDVIILKLSNCVMGMVVDGVTDIVALTPAQIQPVVGAAAVDYLIGVGEVDGRRLIVVDIDKLMSIRKVQFGARQAA